MPHAEAELVRSYSPYGLMTIARCAGPARMPSHSHRRMHLAVVLRGQARDLLPNETTVALGAGDCALLDADVRHRTLFDAPETVMLSLRVAPGAASLLGLRNAARGLWSLDEPLRERLERLALNVLETGRVPERAMFDALDALLLRAHGADAPAWLYELRDRIADSPDDPAGLRQLADAVCRHPSHVSERFSRMFGVGPALFRQRARLRLAIAEARAGATLTDAALTAGFSDSAHLARTARRFAGTTARALAGSPSERSIVALARARR